MSRYGGIDLHGNNHVIVLSDPQDQVIHQKRLPNQLPTILEQLAPYRVANRRHLNYLNPDGCLVRRLRASDATTGENTGASETARRG